MRCDYTEQLKDRIDITRVPFSDRGSRVLVFKAPERDDLYIKLTERLTSIRPGLDTYRLRPPYIQDLHFVDAEGMPLAYHLTTYPHVLLFQTRLGTFQLAFQQWNDWFCRVPLARGPAPLPGRRRQGRRGFQGREGPWGHCRIGRTGHTADCS